jgi:hypothetical protein
MFVQYTIRFIHTVISPSVDPCKALVLWTMNGRISLTASLSPSALAEVTPHPILPTNCLAMNDPTREEIPHCVADPLFASIRRCSLRPGWPATAPTLRNTYMAASRPLNPPEL